VDNKRVLVADNSRADELHSEGSSSMREGGSDYLEEESLLEL
jgi:hypothetical protein